MGAAWHKKEVLEAVVVVATTIAVIPEAEETTIANATTTTTCLIFRHHHIVLTEILPGTLIGAEAARHRSSHMQHLWVNGASSQAMLQGIRTSANPPGMLLNPIPLKVGHYP